MTTPTREQVVQWAKEAPPGSWEKYKAVLRLACIDWADLKHECAAKDQTILSLEATIAEQAMEIESLVYFEKQSSDANKQLRQQLAELTAKVGNLQALWQCAHNERSKAMLQVLELTVQRDEVLTAAIEARKLQLFDSHGAKILDEAIAKCQT